MDTGQLNHAAVEGLLEVFDKIYTQENLLIIDRGVSLVINYLLPFKVFKAKAKFDKIVWNDEHINQDLLKQYQNIVILVDDSSTITIPSHARVHIIVKNLTKLRLYELNDQFNFNLTFDYILEKSLDQGIRVKNGIKIFNWQFHGIVVDGDVISLEDQTLENYFNQPLYQINQINNALVEFITKHRFKANAFYTVGVNSNLLYKLYQDTLVSTLHDNFDSVQQQFYLENLRPTHNVVILERNVDLIPLVMNQLSYVGLIDDLFDININLVKFYNKEIHQEEQIKIDDELFDNLKHLNFSLIGTKLNRLAKLIKTQYSSNASEMNLQEIKKIIENLSDLNKQQDLVKKHTNISEGLLDEIKSGGKLKYNEKELWLNFQHEIFQLAYKQQLTQLLQFLDMSLDETIIINAILLMSWLNSGIKSKDFTLLKEKGFENYGIAFILKLEKLVKLQLVKYSDVENLTTVEEGITGGIDVHNNNYTLLNKFWNLHPDEDSEEEPPEINSLQDYKAPDFTLPCNTVPLSVRLVEALFSREFLVYKPINKITKQPSWQNLGVEKMFRGKVNETRTADDVKQTLIVFLGGITWSEILCIKHLNKVLQAKNLNHQFTILTNGIVNNAQLMQYLQNNN